MQFYGEISGGYIPRSSGLKTGYEEHVRGTVNFWGLGHGLAVNLSLPSHLPIPSSFPSQTKLIGLKDSSSFLEATASRSLFGDHEHSRFSLPFLSLPPAHCDEYLRSSFFTCLDVALARWKLVVVVVKSLLESFFSFLALRVCAVTYFRT